MVKIYKVGGAVRDRLIGRAVIETDWVVVGSSVEQMLAEGFLQVGKDFPVFLHPQTKEEYALARIERKTGPGYQGFSFDAKSTVTLEEDLLRRDLTVNALAETEEGEIIDPYNGLADLDKKILRHVSPAFSEDPVRILRVARFAARYAPLGFCVAEETLQLMSKMVTNGEVNHLVSERVWQELVKALSEEIPSEFFHVLRECGALTVIFPEIDCLYGVPNPEKWHPEIDSGVHTMMVVDMAARMQLSVRARFAALLHDVGKGKTDPANWPRHQGHEEAGVTLIEKICQRLRVPKEYRELAVLVARHHGVCHGFFELRASTIVQLLEKVDAFRREDRFYEFLQTCEADYRGRLGFEQREYPQAQGLRAAYQAAKAVKTAELVKQGFSGEQIKDKLHQLRVSAVKHWQSADPS